MKSEIKVEFKVAMNAEEAKLENHEKITTTVTFPEDCIEQMQADALKNYIIKLQSQIRSHWDKFKASGVPSTITYGSVLFGGTRGARQPTQAEIEKALADKITSLTEEGVAQFISTGKFPEGDEFYKS